jgi:hypothetical protein
VRFRLSNQISLGFVANEEARAANRSRRCGD